MDCNRQIKFLVFEFFLGRREVQKGNCRFGPNFTKSNMPGKMNFLIETRKLSDIGRIISLSNTENFAKICPGTVEIL